MTHNKKHFVNQACRILRNNWLSCSRRIGLRTAIATAIQEAYEAGLRGETLVKHDDAPLSNLHYQRNRAERRKHAKASA